MEGNAVVVIGSGPSGAVAAQVLVGQGIPVTMLESGEKKPGGALVRVNGKSVYRKIPQGIFSEGGFVASGDPKTEWWRNFGLGGLSNQWTGAVPRFAPEDFSEGGRLDSKYLWPLGYDDLASHYSKLETEMKVSANDRGVANLPSSEPVLVRKLPQDWRRIAATAESFGQGLTVMPLADGGRWASLGRGTAFNSYSCIVSRLIGSPNFSLRAGAHALQLEYAPETGKVRAVIYHDRTDGSQKRIECAAVVVACGALNSTKLLFDSACPLFEAGLGNAEGVLGSYLHDHPREWWSFETDLPMSRLSPPAYLTRLPYLKSTPLLASSWTIGLQPSLKEKAMSLTPIKGDSFGIQILGTMIPSDKHYVAPDRERKDEFGLPLLDLHIQYDADTLANMLQARSHFIHVMCESGITCKIGDIEPQLFPGSSVHYGGTIRMHDSPKYGMTDGWGRLHSVPNVVIGDSSCFTTGPEKNPTLTAMALASRAAHRLARDLRTG